MEPNAHTRKGLYIITHGCQMNQYDSVRMAQSLAGGYDEVAEPAQADVIVINTCSVREKPQQKVLAELANLRPLKQANPDLVLVVAGCVAQQEKNNLLELVPYLDWVIGPDKIDYLPELLAAPGPERRALTGFETGDYHQPLHTPLARFGKGGDVSAFIAVQKGCNHFCSYCIVPHVRGREKSRALAEILLEARGLAGRGISELTLLGQNINAYGQDLGDVDFADLLRAVAEVEGIRRIRFVTSHPAVMNPRFIEAIADTEKVCEYLHLPIQAGSDRILEAMRRGYSAGAYLDLIESIRARIPGIALSGDIIVGFPGETEQDFAQTLAVLERVRFDTQFSFIYSSRPGTRAASLDDPVPKEEKLRWLGQLQELQKQHTRQANERQVGTVQEVLFESVSKRSQEELSGRTRQNKIVNVAAPADYLGRYAPVRIVEAHQNSLRGELDHPPGGRA